MVDFCNYLLVEERDVLRVAKHVRRAFADVGVEEVLPETLGAHHATLRGLGKRGVVLELHDDWHPFDRPLARPLSRRLRSAVASCFLHGRAEVEAVTLFDAGHPLASYLIAGNLAEWHVAKAGEVIFRLQLEDPAPTHEENEDAQLAALRKVQARAFRSLPFSWLLRSARWHGLLHAAHAKSKTPPVALSFLDEADDLTAARRFEGSIERAVGSLLSELGFRRTKAPDSAGIAFARDFPSRQLRVQFTGGAARRSMHVTVCFDWLACSKERADPIPTGQRLHLADRVRATELSASFARDFPALVRFAPELREDLERLGRLRGKARKRGEAPNVTRVVDTGQQLYDAAVASRRSGNEDECRAFLRYLVAHYPGHPRAAEAREDLLSHARRAKARLGRKGSRQR